MAKKMTVSDRSFYSGMLAALAVVALHDNETIFREIVETADEAALVAYARADEQMEVSGLMQYGYGVKHHPSTCKAKGMFGADCKNCDRSAERGGRH